MEIPKITWTRTGGTPILGNLDVDLVEVEKASKSLNKSLGRHNITRIFYWVYELIGHGVSSG